MQREAGLCPQRDAALPQCMGGRILPALEVQLRLQQVRVNTLRVASGHLLQQLRHARQVVLPVQYELVKFINNSKALRRATRRCWRG